MPSPARVDPVLTCPCTTGRIKCADPVAALGVVTHSNPPPPFIDLFCQPSLSMKPVPPCLTKAASTASCCKKSHEKKDRTRSRTRN
ncbi:hypothetical protein M0R45_008941 [Rubus argutus]|uniref:Uncharacterized protein n=1 Tax=Rubus argutus TaxID=59490 RepID=A0AAW1Y4J2_RUBAR